MEILLSVRQRTQKRIPTLHDYVCNGVYVIFDYCVKDDFQRIKRLHSYDSTDPFSFTSSFAMELDKSVTCSAKR